MSEELFNQIRSLLVPEFPGWCTPEKGVHLAKVVLEKKPGLIVEVGVFGGKSLIPMAMALKQIGYGLAIGIDPWTLSAALEGDIGQANRDWWSQNVNLDEIYEGFVRKVVQTDTVRFCQWLRIHSERASVLFAPRSIDILSLDANHSYEASCRDVRTWEPKIAERGLWIMDDTDWETQKKAIGMIEELRFKLIYDEGQYHIYQRE